MQTGSAAHVLDSGAVGAGGEMAVNEDACGKADVALEGLVVELVRKGSRRHCWVVGRLRGTMVEERPTLYTCWGHDGAIEGEPRIASSSPSAETQVPTPDASASLLNLMLYIVNTTQALTSPWPGIKQVHIPGAVSVPSTYGTCCELRYNKVWLEGLEGPTAYVGLSADPM